MMPNTTTLRLISASISDKGLSEKRPLNEDSYLELVERGLFAVADGVGGAQAGDVASQMAMEVLFEAFSNPHPGVESEELMEMAIQRANQSIFQMARELPSLDMMATTIVALHTADDLAIIGHVGDSRLYRLDARGNLFRETQDHSVVEEEVRAGRMTLSQAANHPSRNVISRALGAEETVEVDMKTIRFEPGTTFLLCSDGVTRHIPDHELRELLLGTNSPLDVCNEIKNLCYGRGAEDNLTAVIVKAASGASTTPPLDEEETTVPGVRAAAASNGDGFQNSNGNLKSQNEIETDELPPVTHQDTAATQPLAPPGTMSFPASVNNLDDTITDEQPLQKTFNPGEITLPNKLENERLREKVNSAAPLIFEPIEQQKKSGSVGKILIWLLLILIAAAVLAVLIFAFMPARTEQTPAPATGATSQYQPPQVSTLADSGLTAAEVFEFRSFERIRRTVDDNPAVSPNTAAPVTAADFYLRGRAFLQTGNFESALESLKTAQEMLPETTDVDRETLRADVAIAMAAVGAMANNANSKKMLAELINERRQTTRPPVRTVR